MYIFSGMKSSGEERKSRAADWANVPEWQPLSGEGMRSAATWGKKRS